MASPAKKARTEFFPGIEKIPYEGPDSKNPMAFHYYKADEVIMGRTMKEWLRFAVCYWHTWRGNGADVFGTDGTITRPWTDPTLTSMEQALKVVDVHFEFLSKLGVDYYCWHDRDICPVEGANIEETEKNLDIVADKLLECQKKTGVKLLWGTANMFSHKRYMNGAATNPNPEMFCLAAAQVKKAMEVTHRLGGENYVFWGGREGYQCLLNTDLKGELDQLACFLRLAVDHKKAIGATFQLLIEPKPREPCAHQYDFDAATVMGFLKTYGLEKDFKINLEANHGTLAGHSGEHETAMAHVYGFLGSIDANRDEALLGWDTDMFPMNMSMATYIMKCVIAQGGLQPGGLNFDAKVRRESIDVEDLFIGHINGMDCYARGLRSAAKLIEDGKFDAMLKDRYKGYLETDLGKRIRENDPTLSFAELAEHAKKTEEPQWLSGKQEKYESVFNAFV